MDIAREAEAESREPDTCRICREADDEEEPLYHPCRCSGSIRHVHQSCLIRWLSHSQKKHCELCHTTFQFTKVYDPHMPDELPLPVFLQQLVLYAFHNCLSWLRIALVTFVWVAFLPWTIRFVWRALFWSVDGKWPAVLRNETRSSVPEFTDYAELDMPSQTPSNTITNDSRSSILDNFKSLPLRKVFLATAEAYNSSMSAPNQISNPNTRTTFLSDVRFLRNWTRFPIVNNTLLDIIEGQIITLSVVVAFIVLFLIREWVVQRPPVVNFDAQARDGVLEALQRLPPDALEQADDMNIDADGDDDINEHPRLRRRRQRDRHAIRRRVEPRPHRPRHEPPEPAAADGHHSNSEDASADSRVQRRLRPTSDASEVSSEARDLSAMESDDFSSDRVRGSESDARGPGEAAQPHLGLSSAGYRARRPNDERERGSRRIFEEAFADPESHSHRPSTNSFRRRLHMSDADYEYFAGTPLRNSLISFEGMWERAGRNWDEFLRMVSAEGRDDELLFLESVIVARRGPQRSDQDVLPELRDSNPFEIGPLDPFSEASNTSNTERSMPLHSSPPATSASMINFPPSESSPSGIASTGGRTHMRTASSHSSNASSDFDMGYVDRMVDIALDRPTDADQSQAHHESHDNNAANNSNHDSDNHDASEIEHAHSAASTEASSGPESEPVPRDTAAERKSIYQHLTHFFWGNIPGETKNRGRSNERRANVPNADAGNEPDDVPDAPDEAAAEIDPEDADDLDGLLELIGIRGPLFGLLQNSLFCGLLIALSLAAGIWLPYIWGKFSIVLLTDPLQHMIAFPFTFISAVIGMILDSVIAGIGYILKGLNLISPIILQPISFILPGRFIRLLLDENIKGPLGNLSSVMVNGSSIRLRKILNDISYSDTQLPVLSVVSHQALRIHKARLSSLATFFFESGKLIHDTVPLFTSKDGLFRMLGGIPDTLTQLMDWRIWSMAASLLWTFAKKWLILLTPNNWASLTLTTSDGPALDPTLTDWSTMDRVIAVSCGHLFLAASLFLYHRISSTGNPPEQPESTMAEVIREASGVSKVILIIGIEMLAFPLYCGVLLDFALLPLFKNATVVSRIMFSINNPVTSLFIHWFVGTCYMFHFALFVSMCRKIMRPGVLYFIRDPDDPTFHPVRDVLDRNVSTQLRKIGFSGLFYVGLIVVCIGGIMWSVAYMFKGVFPLHLSMDEPLSQYPIDLLVYILVMPALVSRLRMSDFLTDLYEFWFRRVARQLRLTQFLVGIKAEDEEGHYVYSSWLNYILRRPEKEPTPKLKTCQHHHHRRHYRHHHHHHHQHTSSSSSTRIKRDRSYKFVRDGKYVRAPATDQVRVPKGTPVFLEVDRRGRRIDGRPFLRTDFHSSSHYSKYHLPPRFKLRIFLFTFLVWMFAAVTGVMATVLPLLVGRRVLAATKNAGFGPVNDISSFNIGMFIVGGAFLVFLDVMLWIDHDGLDWRTLSRNGPPFVYELTKVILRLSWLAATCGVLLPLLVTSLLQLYIMIPLNTYFTGSTHYSVHLVHDWALGLLLLRIAIAFSLRHAPRSKLSNILRALIRDNPIRPDTKLAMRAFVLPALLLFPFAIALPTLSGYIWNLIFFSPQQVHARTLVYRYSYPATIVALTHITVMFGLGKKISFLKTKLRNDFYQIGEQLRNREEGRENDEIES